MTPIVLAPSAGLIAIAAVWLTIKRVRERATQHGGSIDVVSSVGDGTTFTVTIERTVSPDEKVFIPSSRCLHVTDVQ